MKRLLPIAAVILGSLSACGDSVDANLALEEPIRIGYFVAGQPFEAQFFAGELPAPSGGPPIAGVDVGPAQAAPGRQDKSGYVVRLDRSAYAVAIRLKDRKNGYWIARVDQREALFENQVSASLTFDIAPTLTPGPYQIELSGVGRNASFGERALAPLTVVPRVPVEATTVIELRWDAPVDLDLQVRAPDGIVSSAKRRIEALGFDGDSVASCIDDGLHEENVYFLNAPAPGSYGLYVNPFSLCGRIGANYEVTVTRGGVQTERFFGRVAEAEQRVGGFGVGDFVANITF